MLIYMTEWLLWRYKENSFYGIVDGNKKLLNFQFLNRANETITRELY